MEGTTDNLGTHQTEGRTRTEDFKTCIKAKLAFKEYYKDEIKKRKERIMREDLEISTVGAHQLALAQLWGEEPNHQEWVKSANNSLTTASDYMYE